MNHNKGKEKLLDDEDEEEEEDAEQEKELRKGERKFDVVRWRAVTTWSWGIECEAISRSPNPSQRQLAECEISWGMCNHSFHHHCIRRWLRARTVCPLDNTEWKYQRFPTEPRDAEAFWTPDPLEDVEPTD